MAQGDATDLLMKFKRHHRDPHAIRGGSTTNLISAEGYNELLTGFEANQMFEVDSFTFKTGIVDESTANQKKPGNAGSQRGGKPDPQQKVVSSTPGEFQDWRAGKPFHHTADLQPVSFTRPIDISSTELMDGCIHRFVFDSATLIKRKAAGGPAAGEVFLRLDFYGVLVVGVEWSNDLEVKETCQFICRGTTVSYRPQLPDGTLGGTIASFWSMVPKATQPKYS